MSSSATPTKMAADARPCRIAASRGALSDANKAPYLVVGNVTKKATSPKG